MVADVVAVGGGVPVTSTGVPVAAACRLVKSLRGCLGRYLRCVAFTRPPRRGGWAAGRGSVG